MTKTAEQTKDKPANDDSFRIESISKSEPPDGAEKDNWYRYVIIQGGFVMQKIPQREAEASLKMYQEALKSSGHQ